jgi:hypothetical protein
MDGFEEIEQRVQRLSARGAFGFAHVTPDDTGALLDEAYSFALKADARARRLRARLEECLGDGDGSADEARRIAAEKRSVEESAQRLRARLEALRPLLASAAACAGSG